MAPLPFRNSQIGWGVAVMVGLIHGFDADTTIKPSTGAVTGLVSENGSWGVMALEIARFGNYPKHLRLDYAWGRDGGLLYFSVGEAF